MLFHNVIEKNNTIFRFASCNSRYYLNSKLIQYIWQLCYFIRQKMPREFVLRISFKRKELYFLPKGRVVGDCFSLLWKNSDLGANKSWLWLTNSRDTAVFSSRGGSVFYICFSICWSSLASLAYLPKNVVGIE